MSGHKKHRPRFLFNPLERHISGRIELLTELIAQLSAQWRIGVAGPVPVPGAEFLNIESHLCWTQTHLRDCDFALIYSTTEQSNLHIGELGDVPPIADRLERWIQRTVNARPLHGLVLVGGKSSRMGADKASLCYQNHSQAAVCTKLLQTCCEEVALSARPGQAVPDDVVHLPRVDDCFLEMGPLGGILSALHSEPNAAWLVLGCDLPLVCGETLDALLDGRRPTAAATAFKAVDSGFPEPLCAIYEPKIIFDLLHVVATGNCCPRKVLVNCHRQLLEQESPLWLANANTPDEAKRLQVHVEAQRKRSLTEGYSPASTRAPRHETDP